MYLAIIIFFFCLGEGSIGPHLLGRTCFRDNIEDEWLVVHLLLTLSKEYDDFVIRLV